MDAALDLRRLNSLALDAFRELGNIGSGHASGALAAMLGHKVDMTVPKIELFALTTADDLRADHREVFTVNLRLDGDLHGAVVLCLPIDTAAHLIRLLTGQSLSVEDPLGASVISELANIVGGSFLSAFYGMTGLNAFLTPPEHHAGSYCSVLSTVLVEARQWGDYAFAVESAFICDANVLPCHLLFIPSPPGMVTILRRMGLTDIFG